MFMQVTVQGNKAKVGIDKCISIHVTEFAAQSNRSIHRKGREERKAQRQISLRSGMKIINSELVRTLYELTLPEFVSVCFSSLFFPDRITRIGRIYTDPGAQRLEKALWYEKNSNEHNELDELTPPGFVLVRTSSLFSSCSSMYQRFIADSVYSMFDQLHSYSFFQNKFRNNKPQMSVLLILSVINILTALGLRPQTPAYAPPLAGFNMKSLVAYYHYYPYMHCILK